MATIGDQEAAVYARDGVIRIRGFLPPERVAEIRAEIQGYIRESLPSQAEPDCTFEQDGSTVRNLWRLERHSDYFRRLAERREFVETARRLLPGEPALMAVETFNKPARLGSGVPYHQDNAYFCQSPPDVLTMWIAIDAVTVENGAVCYLKGSHVLGMLPTQASGTAGNSIGLVEAPSSSASERFCCTLQPGDLAVHHCQTVHHSSPNTTDRPRLGLLLVYRGAHTHTDDQLQAAYQRAQGQLGAGPSGSVN